MFANFKAKLVNEDSLIWFFRVWLILLPFDASFLPVSIGFMIVYPFLILTFFVARFSLFLKPKQCYSWIAFGLLGFYILWSVFGVWGHHIAIQKQSAYDAIRPLIWLFLVLAIIWQFCKIVGENTFLKEIKHGAQIGILFLVRMFFFEYLIGILWQENKQIKYHKTN